MANVIPQEEQFIVCLSSFGTPIPLLLRGTVVFGLRRKLVVGGELILNDLFQALERFRTCATASKLLNSKVPKRNAGLFRAA